MIRVLLCSLLSLTAINAVAANLSIFKDENGRVLLTNVAPTGEYAKYNKKVTETYYRGNSSKDTATATKNTKTNTTGLAQKSSELDSSSVRSNDKKNSTINAVYLAMADDDNQHSKYLNVPSNKNEHIIFSTETTANTPLDYKDKTFIKGQPNKSTAYQPSEQEIARGIEMNKQKSILEAEASAQRLHDKKVADTKSVMAKAIIGLTMNKILMGKFLP